MQNPGLHCLHLARNYESYQNQKIQSLLQKNDELAKTIEKCQNLSEQLISLLKENHKKKIDLSQHTGIFSLMNELNEKGIISNHHTILEKREIEEIVKTLRFSSERQSQTIQMQTQKIQPLMTAQIEIISMTSKILEQDSRFKERVAQRAGSHS